MSVDVLRLYRHILKSALVFPSKNRERIVKEIKFEFRNNRNLTNIQDIGKALNVAKKGLAQLSMYSNLPKHSDWAVTLDQEPMPKGPMVDVKSYSS